MKIGIIGLPNVGKSTLFTALTKKQAACENYPFCTIEPNVGIVPVPDPRLEALSQVLPRDKTVPTVVEFVDIAGLVAGAHKGQGLGNKFLSYIKEVDALCQVIRLFKNKDVHHIAGRVDPKSDIETINLELVMKDLDLVVKRIDGLSGKARIGDKGAQKQLQALKEIKKVLDQGQAASKAVIDKGDIALIADLNLLTLKPMLYIFNVDEETAGYQINQQISSPNLCLNIQQEAELADLPEQEIKEYLKEFNLVDSGLNKLIGAAYQMLNLITFYTLVGKKETRAWAIKKNTTAQDAAGKIHSDIKMGFIKAEVINWNILIKAGSWSVAKEAGLIRIEGKDYLIQDGDVCYFRFAT